MPAAWAPAVAIAWLIIGTAGCCWALYLGRPRGFADTVTPGEYVLWCGAAQAAQEELRNGVPPAPPSGNGKPIIEGECSEVPDPLLLEGPNPWLS